MLNLTVNWKRVIDTLPKGVVVIDTDGKIRHINPAFEALTGYRSGELIGNPCTILECSGCEPWYDDNDVWCMLFSAERSFEPTVCSIDSRTGRRLTVFRQASVLRDAVGVVVGAVETIWDVEDFKEGSAHESHFPSLCLHL